MQVPSGTHFDFIIVGSGFGGSVSALRLCEKGYRVLMIEKGRRFAAAEDFPKTNWDLRRWLWMPQTGLRGFFKMTFMKHVTIFSGVGVGGGSLVYANTLPIPKDDFFEKGTWAGIADWKRELAPHYKTARRMLGASKNPTLFQGDKILREIANDIGRGEHFEPTHVSVYFGEPGKTVPDPYFDGKGPSRTGCIYCGACMTGCRHNSKNTLDKNYLYLAEQLGLTILPETEVVALRPGAKGGYEVHTRASFGMRKRPQVFTSDRAILSGGVLGTIELLLKMKSASRGLPHLSRRTGELIRTNSESLIGVVSRRRDINLSKGVAIGSILHTDDYSHIEPVRYGEGSNFFRTLIAPHAPGETFAKRLWGVLAMIAKHPVRMAQKLSNPHLAKFSQILLYMRTMEGTLRFSLGRGPRTGFQSGLESELSDGEPPQAFIPEATELAERFAEKIDGTPTGMVTELLQGVPSTAHILGGACIGKNPDEGVIDAQHQVFGYPGLYVIDGSSVSANPGVNPSLTITAMAERAMTFIPKKNAAKKN